MTLNRNESWSTWTVMLLVAIFVFVGLASAVVPSETQAGPAEKKPDLPKLEDTVKGFKKHDGFFPLYSKGEELFLFVPKARQDQLFLLAISVAGGPQFAGYQWDDMAVKWERLDKKLLLVRPNLRHRAKKGTPLAEVVGRTYTESVIRALDIKAASSDGGVLLDASRLFKSDLGRVGRALGSLGGRGYELVRTISRWADVKTFPNNVEIAVLAGFQAGSPGDSGGQVADPRGTRMRIHYSLSAVPKSSYKPRSADPRVGYFMTAVKDYSGAYHEKTQFRRMVNRWDLQKLDPELEVSPPAKPIVYYIEKTVPVRFRRYVREGIELWNKAYRKVGLVGAIEVRQQTDSNEFAKLDPEDVRYNFFRWITSGTPFAMGPSRVNPTTGEILDADIIMDDSYVRYMTEDFRQHSVQGGWFSLDPNLERYLQDNPRLNPASRRLGPPPGLEPPTANSTASNTAFLELMKSRGRPVCMIAQGRAQQLALARAAAIAKGMEKLPEEFIGEFVRETVAHEVGHTLGLRHNFKASSWLSLDEINSEERPGALSASVMDYNATNFTAKDEIQGHYQMVDLGPYDYWAIEYGYRQAGKGEKEDELLAKIAARGSEPGHAFATDEDASFASPDPLTTRWDLGDDPIAFARSRARLINELLVDLPNRAVKDGEAYDVARRAFDVLLGEQARSISIAARLVGGQYVNRDHKGDPNGRPPLEVVAPERQREALQFLSETILSEKPFSYSPEILNWLGFGRWNHWGSQDYDWRVDYPVHDRILSLQSMVFFHLTGSYTIGRIHDAELKVAPEEDAFTLPELFEGLSVAIWSELDRVPSAESSWSNRQPFVGSLRRPLQREHLGFLIGLVLGPTESGSLPSDAATLAWAELRDLSGRIKSALKAHLDGVSLDRYSRAHLEESQARIEKALDAAFTLNGGGGGGGFSITFGKKPPSKERK